MDKRLSQVSARRARTDEVLRLEALYRESHQGWSVTHFHDVYRERHAGERSYTWVKNRLQEAGLAAKGKRRGTPRRRRERAPIPGLLVHAVRPGDGGAGHRDDPVVLVAVWATPDELAAFGRDGFFIREAAIDGDWLESLRDALDRCEASI